MNPKRRIHKFLFEEPMLKNGQKTHVAIVDHAANLAEALVIKSVSTSSTVIEEPLKTDLDTGDSTRETHTTEVRDYGGDTIYVTDTLVRVVETAYPKIKII